MSSFWNPLREKPLFHWKPRLNPEHPMNIGLARWWLINEMAGANLYDVVQNSPLGMVGAVPWVNTDKGPAIGPCSTSNYYKRADTTITGYPISLSARLFVLNVTAAQYLVGLDNTAASSAELLFSANLAGDPIRMINQGSGFGAAASTVGPDGLANIWIHGAGVATSATSRAAYYNGANKGTNTTDSGAITIVHQAVGARPFTPPETPCLGYIGDAKIWVRALSDSEVYWDYLEPYGDPRQPRLLIEKKRSYYVIVVPPTTVAPTTIVTTLPPTTLAPTPTTLAPTAAPTTIVTTIAPTTPPPITVAKFIATVKSASGDYTCLSDAITGLANDLTLTTIKVFSISAASTPTIAAGDSVTGVTSGATGTCVLVNAAQTQILIKSIANGPFQDGETVKKSSDAAVNVTLSSDGDSPIVEIQPYAITDTTPVIVPNTFVTDALRYLSIYVPLTERHGRVKNYSKYILDIATNVPVIEFEADTNYCLGLRIDGIQARSSAPSAHGVLHIYTYRTVTGVDCRISNNLIDGKGTADYGIICDDISSTGTYKLWNNIVYDTVTGGIAHDSTEDSITSYLYNNTVYGTNRGIVCVRPTGSNQMVAKNNIVQGTITDGYYSTFAASSTNNLSDHADAPGANPQNSKTLTFVNLVGRNLYLDHTDTSAIDQGISDPGSGLFSDDAEGTARGVTWCIGALEYTPPLTTAPPTTLKVTTLTPTTLAPTVLPTTLAPTLGPTTLAPTLPPTTVVPPTTIAPTVAPTTLAPTLAPTTLSPVECVGDLSETGDSEGNGANKIFGLRITCPGVGIQKLKSISCWSRNVAQSGYARVAIYTDAIYGQWINLIAQGSAKYRSGVGWGWHGSIAFVDDAGNPVDPDFNGGTVYQIHISFDSPNNETELFTDTGSVWGCWGFSDFTNGFPASVQVGGFNNSSFGFKACFEPGEPTTPPATTLTPTTIVTTPTPTTLAPTATPTTSAPTVLPTTPAPTSAPTTIVTTIIVPTTSIPTQAPTTLAPTLPPTTEAPTSLAPTTKAPTVAPTTVLPTTKAPTPAPTTLAPTTKAPTLPPTTPSPTTAPPTLAPTTRPATVFPTTIPSTTTAPTTLLTSLAPTTTIAVLPVCIKSVDSFMFPVIPLDSLMTKEVLLHSPITKEITLGDLCR